MEQEEELSGWPHVVERLANNNTIDEAAAPASFDNCSLFAGTKKTYCKMLIALFKHVQTPLSVKEIYAHFEEQPCFAGKQKQTLRNTIRHVLSFNKIFEKISSNDSSYYSCSSSSSPPPPLRPIVIACKRSPNKWILVSNYETLAPMHVRIRSAKKKQAMKKREATFFSCILAERARYIESLDLPPSVAAKLA